jgi:hypothetical protein
MNFYNSGYGYERSDDGYVISHGQIPSKRGYQDVWSAFDDIPPNGNRILNGNLEFFYSRDTAIQACVYHSTLTEAS